MDKIYLVYVETFKDACPDDLLGVFESRELAQEAINNSYYSDYDKRTLLYIDEKRINKMF